MTAVQMILRNLENFTAEEIEQLKKGIENFQTKEQLAVDAFELIKSGNMLMACKLFKERLEIGLKEAKTYVDKLRDDAKIPIVFETIEKPYNRHWINELTNYH